MANFSGLLWEVNLTARSTLRTGLCGAYQKACMSLKPESIQPVPEETARVARAVHLKGHPYLTLRDELGTIFEDEDFVDLFPK